MVSWLIHARRRQRGDEQDRTRDHALGREKPSSNKDRYDLFWRDNQQGGAVDTAE
jgi:hypothetical protein